MAFMGIVAKIFIHAFFCGNSVYILIYNTELLNIPALNYTNIKSAVGGEVFVISVDIWCSSSVFTLNIL